MWQGLMRAQDFLHSYVVGHCNIIIMNSYKYRCYCCYTYNYVAFMHCILFYSRCYKTVAVFCRIQMEVEGLHNPGVFTFLEAWLFDYQFTCA